MSLPEEERKKIYKEAMKEFWREELRNFKASIGSKVINVIIIAIFIALMTWFFQTNGGKIVSSIPAKMSM